MQAAAAAEVAARRKEMQAVAAGEVAARRKEIVRLASTSSRRSLELLVLGARI